MEHRVWVHQYTWLYIYWYWKSSLFNTEILVQMHQRTERIIFVLLHHYSLLPNTFLPALVQVPVHYNIFVKEGLSLVDVFLNDFTLQFTVWCLAVHNDFICYPGLFKPVWYSNWYLPCLKTQSPTHYFFFLVTDF
jgi:hypothetical protein